MQSLGPKLLKGVGFLGFQFSIGLRNNCWIYGSLMYILSKDEQIKNPNYRIREFTNALYDNCWPYYLGVVDSLSLDDRDKLTLWFLNIKRLQDLYQEGELYRKRIPNHMFEIETQEPLKLIANKLKGKKRI